MFGEVQVCSSEEPDTTNHRKAMGIKRVRNTIACITHQCPPPPVHPAAHPHLPQVCSDQNLLLRTVDPFELPICLPPVRPHYLRAVKTLVYHRGLNVSIVLCAYSRKHNTAPCTGFTEVASSTPISSEGRKNVVQPVSLGISLLR